MPEELFFENEPIQYRPLPYTPFSQPNFTSNASKKFKFLQKLKLVLGALTLLPIRIVLLIFSAISAGIFAYISTSKVPVTVYGIPATV